MQLITLQLIMSEPKAKKSKRNSYEHPVSERGANEKVAIVTGITGQDGEPHLDFTWLSHHMLSFLYLSSGHFMMHVCIIICVSGILSPVDDDDSAIHKLHLIPARLLPTCSPVYLPGSYLTEFLIEKGYTVHGIIRRSSSFNTGRISHLYDNPKIHSQKKMVLHYGDLSDGACEFFCCCTCAS